MCVILAAVGDSRPSEKMVREAWKKNDDGGGIAYREPAQDGEGMELVWKKSLGLDDMVHLCATVDLPFIAHFRIASSGGIRPELCHPFPVNVEAPRTLEGRSKTEYVLFHNGDWRDWQDYVLKCAVNPVAPDLPPGKWNDTRAMSWLCSIYGIHFMDLIEHKGVAFSANDYEIFVGKDGWKKINGVWCSNDYFWGNGPRDLNPGPAAREMCKDRSCSVQFGLEKGYCNSHRHLRDSTVPERLPRRESTPDNPAVEQNASDVIADVPAEADKRPKLNKKGNQVKKEVICQECRALLTLGIGHSAECSKQNITGLGACPKCQVPSGRPHMTTCETVNKGFGCFECKQQIQIPKDHLMNCSHFDKPISMNRFINRPASGGTQFPNDPFHVILTAAKAVKDGTMSKQELKIVKKRLGFVHQPTNDIPLLEKWAMEERRKATKPLTH